MFLYLLMMLDVVEGSLNVGTVLFKDIDTARSCWTREEISLLNSRRILQDLIPQEILNAETDEFIPAILDYFEACVEAVEAIAQGKAQQFMLLALADSFGGWLHVYALPFAKERYYAGTVRYEYMRNLHEFYEELKAFLMTNGTGWMHPKLVHSNDIQPLEVEPSFTVSDPCSALIVYEKPKNPEDENTKQDAADYEVVIPMPILDDKENPNAIAMPFQKNGLRSLTVPSSAYLLKKYYVAGIKCIMSSGSSTAAFSHELHKWIVTEVLPHLHNDKWYPAFGGVLRILRTMRNQGIDQIEPSQEAFKPEARNLLPYHPRHMSHFIYEEPEKTSNVDEAAMYRQLKRQLILGIVLTLLILIIISLAYCCFKRFRKTSAPTHSYRKLDRNETWNDENKRNIQFSPVERSPSVKTLNDFNISSTSSTSSSDTEQPIGNAKRRGSQSRSTVSWSTHNANHYQPPSVNDLYISGQRSSILTSESSVDEDEEETSDGRNTVDITTPKKTFSI